jgi:hypothetical protein
MFNVSDSNFVRISVKDSKTSRWYFVMQFPWSYYQNKYVIVNGDYSSGNLCSFHTKVHPVTVAAV